MKSHPGASQGLRTGQGRAVEEVIGHGEAARGRRWLGEVSHF